MGDRSVLPFHISFQMLRLTLPNNYANMVCLWDAAGVSDVAWTRVGTRVNTEPRGNLVISAPGSVLMGKHVQEDFTIPDCLCTASCLQRVAVKVKYLSLTPNQE